MDEATYWRRRIGVLLVAVLLLVVLASSTTRLIDNLSVTGQRTSSSTEPISRPGVPDSGALGAPGAVYVVEPGDTLWSIAQKLAPGEDPRPIVDRLAARAGGASLRPGQRLSLEGVR